METFDCVLPLNITLTTTGKSLYSRTIKDITFTSGEVIDYSNYDVAPDHEDFYYSGEFRLYFDPKQWCVSDDGLIYTDTDFLKLLHAEFAKLGVSDDVHYSELGMQGGNYISFDVDHEFMKTFNKLGGDS